MYGGKTHDKKGVNEKKISKQIATHHHAGGVRDFRLKIASNEGRPIGQRKLSPIHSDVNKEMLSHIMLTR